MDASAPLVGDRLLSRLDPAQLAAVESRAPRVVVVAGPGSGKTSVLAARVVTLIRLRGVRPHEVAAFTFTREAAAELRGRVAQSVGLEAAGRLTCSTLHGLAAGVLARVLDDDFRIADEDEEAAILEGLVSGPERRPEFSGSGAAKFGKRRLRAMVELYGAGLETPETLRLMRYVLHRFDAVRLRPRFALIHPAALLLGGKWIVPGAETRIRDERRRLRVVRHVLIDEGQDLTAGEAALLEAAYPEAARFAVLDPNQAIFGWRHAETANLRTLMDGPPSQLERLELSTSYRFGQEIADEAGRWIGGRSLRGASGPGTVTASSASRLAAHVASLIVSHRGAGNVAVLCRTNEECRDVARLIGPYAVHVTRDTATYSRDFRLLVVLARFLVNPDDSAAFESLARMLGRDDATIAAWKAKAGIRGLARPALEDPGEAGWWPLDLAARCLPSWTWDDVASTVNGLGVYRCDGAEPIADVCAWTGADHLPLQDALDALTERTEQSGFDAASRRGLVAVATVHAAKGREWDAVVLWNPPAAPDRLADEERRVWFVARTRARRELVILRATGQEVSA